MERPRERDTSSGQGLECTRSIRCNARATATRFALRWRGSAFPIISSRSTSSRARVRSEEHTSELQSLRHLVCRLLLEKKKNKKTKEIRTYKHRHTTNLNNP